jgi:hypothetical protein
MTGIEQAAPSGTYRFRVPVTLTSGASTGTALVALYAFNSANSHMTQGGFITGSARVTGFFVDNYNSFTSYAISPKSPSTNDMVRAGGWLEFEYDGTNVIWRVSSTGQRGSFTTIYSVATSSHLAAAPTHIGLALFTDATAAATVGPWRRLA